MKKLLSLVLALIAITTMTAFANNEGIMLINEPEAVEECSTPAYLSTYGEIKETGEDFILVETIDGNEIQFNTSEITQIIDANTVLPLDLASRETDKVMVTYSPAMTMSIPPQSYAFAIIGNIKAEAGNPIFTIVENVISAEDGIVIVTENGTKEITVPSTAKVSPYMTRNIVTLEDIKAGSNVLLWYDMMTMSIPAYATSERAVIFAGNLFDIYNENDALTVNGVEIKLSENEIVYNDNGVEMLPLRKVAETLGFTVEWINETQSIIISKGTAFNATLRIGEEGYGINRARFMLEAAPFLHNGDTTYVPAAFFTELPAEN